MAILQIKHLTVGEGVPKIIIPLVGETEEEILQEAELIKNLQPDVVEWRVDFYTEVEKIEYVQNMLAKLREIFVQPLLLFTFRSHKEGGQKEISDEYYVQLNQQAIETKKIDLVDVELFNDQEYVEAIVSKAKENDVFVIMSNHDFHKTPNKEEIISRLRQMQEYGADIPKIAVMPTSVSDVITLLDATNTMNTQYGTTPFITMSMGGKGVISRLAGEVFGSAFTFAAGKEASAPGQIPVEELRTVLEILHKSM